MRSVTDFVPQTHCFALCTLGLSGQPLNKRLQKDEESVKFILDLFLGKRGCTDNMILFVPSRVDPEDFFVEHNS